MTHALAMLVHHLAAAQVVDANGELTRRGVDHAGAQVERYPGPLQGVDLMGPQIKARIVRLGGHSNADLGTVGQRPTRPRVALIRGSDGEIVIAPEILGWFIVQLAGKQVIDIDKRTHQGDLAGTCTLHPHGAASTQQG